MTPKSDTTKITLRFSRDPKPPGSASRDAPRRGGATAAADATPAAEGEGPTRHGDAETGEILWHDIEFWSISNMSCHQTSNSNIKSNMFTSYLFYMIWCLINQRFLGVRDGQGWRNQHGRDNPHGIKNRINMQDSIHDCLAISSRIKSRKIRNKTTKKRIVRIELDLVRKTLFFSHRILDLITPNPLQKTGFSSRQLGISPAQIASSTHLCNGGFNGKKMGNMGSQPKSENYEAAFPLIQKYSVEFQWSLTVANKILGAGRARSHQNMPKRRRGSQRRIREICYSKHTNLDCLNFSVSVTGTD